MAEVEVKRRIGKEVEGATPHRAAPVLRSINDPLEAQKRRARLRAAFVMTGLVIGVALIGASLYLLVFQSSDVRVPSAGSVPTLPTGTSQASLSFVVEPLDAQITLNGRRMDGAQDASHELDPGSYLVSVRADGHARLDSLVQLRSNSAFVFVASLEPLAQAGDLEEEFDLTPPPPPTPTQGALSISANVAGARVMIDGRLVGRTPVTTSLSPGSYTVRLEADGHRPTSRSIEVIPGSTFEISENLIVHTGFVRVLVIPWGSVFVDGRLHAENTDIRQTIELPAGRHTVRADHPVLGRLERTVDVRPDESIDVVLEFSP
jgi:hypothetical protein